LIIPGRKLPSIFQTLDLQEIDAKAEIALLRGRSTRAKIWGRLWASQARLLIDVASPLKTTQSFIHLMNPTTWALDYAL